MSVALDTQQYTSNSGNSPFSISHTCSGSDRYLLVHIATGQNVSGVTYNGVAMTKLSEIHLTALVDIRLQVWGLKNPASGTHNVTVTPSGAPDSQRVNVSSWTGVDQTIPTGTVVTDTQDAQNGSITSVALTTSANDMGVDAMMTYSRTVSPGGTQNALTGSGSATPTLAGSYKSGVNVTLTESFSSNQIRCAIGVPLKAVASDANNGAGFFGMM